MYRFLDKDEQLWVKIIFQSSSYSIPYRMHRYAADDPFFLSTVRSKRNQAPGSLHILRCKAWTQKMPILY